MAEAAPPINEFLVTHLARRRGITEADVAASLAQTSGIDSLEGVELILDAEEHLGVSIPDDALSPVVCRSMAELARLISAHLGR